MTDLKLEVGEGILLQTNDAGLYDGNNEIDIDELYLTNKNIIYVHEKSSGFLKTETVVDKLPLSTIAVINGVVQVEQVNDNDYGESLQIIYTSGRRELLELNVSPKKQYPAWKNAIIDAVIRLTTGAPAPQVVTTPPSAPAVEEEKNEKAFASATLFAGFKSAVDTAKQTFSKVTQTATEIFNGNTNTSSENNTAMRKETIKEEKNHFFCSNCGEKLGVGSKFCNSCGTPVGTVPTEPQKEEPVVVVTPPPIKEDITPLPITEKNNQEEVKTELPNEPSTERKTVYDGEIHKCPNCGAVINGATVVCPNCGMHITRQYAVNSVQVFKDQLMQLENSRRAGIGGYILSSSALLDPVDKKKLALITNFPIPNSVEDIMEFMLLAIININVGLSKGKWDKRPPRQETGYTIKRTLSNAWVSKMIHAYQKAEILFPNDPAFSKIQKIYLEKAAELKMKIK